VRNVHDLEPGVPASVEAGERFIVLSDEDVWDSSPGCCVYIFLRDYQPSKPAEPNALNDEGFREAMLRGSVFEVELDELIDTYIQARWLAKSV
jgi:hypothetical protein